MEPFTIPNELMTLDRWLCWRNEIRSSRPTKVPVGVNTNRSTDVTNVANLTSYINAIEHAKAHTTLAGVGFAFVLDDGLVGIDLDGCIRDSAVVEAAAKVITALGSYAEISPSGNGVKIIMRGLKPAHARCRSRAIPGVKGVEVYDRDRFFTITGRHLAGTPLEITNNQSALDALASELWPSHPQSARSVLNVVAAVTADDDALIRKAHAARNGHRFARLWDGDIAMFNGDHSAADLALCSMLNFWTRGDAARIDRLFRRSGLFRSKWDERRNSSTYGWHTIAKAMAGHNGGSAAACDEEVHDGAR